MRQPKQTIPFLYYKLDRAARHLECEIHDLIHLGVIGGIELCVMLSGLECEIITEDEGLIKNDVSVSHPAIRRNLTSYSYFDFSAISRHGEGWEPEIEEEDEGIFSAKGYAHGLWALSDGVSCLEFANEMNHEGALFLPGSNGRVVISPLVVDGQFNATITLNDIYITKDDVKRIKDGRVSDTDFKVSSKSNERNKLSYVTTKASENKKDKLIKAMIEMFYGYGSSEKIRSLINEERNTGELLLDFQKNGIKPPVVSKTLAAWMEDVEIERVVASTPSKDLSKT